MGISWSSNRRRNNNGYYHQHHQPSQLIASSSSSSSYPYPPSQPYPAPPPYLHPAHPPPLPPPPPPAYYTGGGYSGCDYANPMVGRPNYGASYYPYQNNGWNGTRPPLQLMPPSAVTPPPYVDNQKAKKVRNDVNVHKDTLKLVVDEHNPDHHLLSFVFDAIIDGSFTIFYFAKEELDCRFVSLYPEACTPVKFPFQKGTGQKFCQPSGTGIDLGFFELDDLSKPSPGEDVFPLVICGETCLPIVPTEEQLGDPPRSSPHMQITQAIIQKNSESAFSVRVVKQILWIDDVRYELREIYGIGNSAEENFKDDEPGKECVICLTDPKDTAVLPCRHMCMCSECAKALRVQSNKCPICRQPIEELIEIKISRDDHSEASCSTTT